MYARCPHCPSCNWVEPPPANGFTEIVCGTCGANGIARNADTQAASLRQMHVKTLALAERHGIDFASAYSVLLNLMPIERAEELRDLGVASVTPEKPPPAALPGLASPGESAAPNFDPGFHEAVQAGRLSVQEALGRGDRDSLVGRLMQRHRLTVDLACLVADKRMPLAEALRQSQRVEAAVRTRPQPDRPRRGVTRGQIAAVVALAVVALTGLAAGMWSRQTSREPVAPAPIAAAERPRDPGTVRPDANAGEEPVAELAEPALVDVERDDRGRVVRVEGSDPRSVLEAFCEATGFQRSALEVADTKPPAREAMLGIFLDPAAEPPRRSIRIQRDWRSRRWVTGAGNGPVPERPADEPAQTASNRTPQTGP